VPLNVVYDHHWTAIASTHKNALCQGSIEYVFGIGAESRNNGVNFPDGYGYVVTADTIWNANIHLLRTEGLAGDNPLKAAKECNECYYAATKGAKCTPAKNGTFDCCGEDDYDGVSSCPTVANPPEPKNYSLRYTFSYTRDLDAVDALQVGTISAPGCKAFFQSPRNDEEPEQLFHYTVTVSRTIAVPFAIGHLHTGAINISLVVNGERICTSYPTYGTEDGVPGNERGYLVAMSPCVDVTQPYLILRKGDVARVEAHYYAGSHDPRLLYSDGTHLNVMAYLYLVYKVIGEDADAQSPIDADSSQSHHRMLFEPL